MKIMINFSIAYDEKQKPKDEERPWNNTISYQDTYKQEVEVSSVELATAIQSKVIRAFNGFKEK